MSFITFEDFFKSINVCSAQSNSYCFTFSENVGSHTLFASVHHFGGQGWELVKSSFHKHQHIR